MSEDRSQPTEAESFLRSTRGDHAASRADRERVRNALAQKLAQSSSATASATKASPLQRAFSGLRALGATGKVTISMGVLAALVFTTRYASEPVKPSLELPPPQLRHAQPSPIPSTPSAVPAATATPIAPALPRTSERASGDTLRVKARAKPARRSVEAAEPPLTTMQTPSEAPQTHTVEAAAASAAVSGREPARKPPLPAAAVASRTPVEPSPVRSAEDAREELAFVRRMQAALVNSKPEQVLALCQTHARRWPHGTFEQEREGLRAIAACQSVLARGPALARSFIAKYPQSPMLPRVREACPPQAR